MIFTKWDILQLNTNLISSFFVTETPFLNCLKQILAIYVLQLLVAYQPVRTPIHRPGQFVGLALILNELIFGEFTGVIRSQWVKSLQNPFVSESDVVQGDSIYRAARWPSYWPQSTMSSVWLYNASVRKERTRSMLHLNGTSHKIICSSVCRHRPRKTYYSWRQREQVGGWGDWHSTPLIWFIFKQASLYTCRIKQTHPFTLRTQRTHIHNMCSSRCQVSVFSTARGRLHWG